MNKLLILLAIVGLSFTMASEVSAQVNVGRFQLVSVSAGQQAGVFMMRYVAAGF